MTTANQQRLPAATWNVDPIHSTVGFAVKYMVSTFRTEFDRYDGDARHDRAMNRA